MKEYIDHWASLCESEGSRVSGRHEIPKGAIPFRVGFAKVEDIRIEDLLKDDLANEGIDVKPSEDADMDDGTIIGSFMVGDEGCRLTVYIRSNEKMTPHFHVFDKAGMYRTQAHKGGFHTCVEIETSRYFKHDVYMDNLDKASMSVLDAFMRERRTSPKYNSGVGLTNFEHTVNEWNDNNAQDRKRPMFVNPKTAIQPDYTDILTEKNSCKMRRWA